jgi:PAS domain S-box-containing protein
MDKLCTFRWITATQRVHLPESGWALLDLPPLPEPTLDQVLRYAGAEDLPGIRAIVATATGRRNGFRFEARLLCAGHPPRVIRVVAEPVCGEEGALEYLGWMQEGAEAGQPTAAPMLEIERARGEARQFHLMLDQAPGLIWSALPDGYIDFLNLRWLEYTGTRLEDTRGWGWQITLHPDDLPPLLEIWKGLLTTGQPGDAKARLRRADGVYRWHLFRATPYHDADGKLVKWYGQTVDIEDFKRAENLLAAERSILEMLAKSASLGATLDATCRMMDAMLPNCVSSVWLLDDDGCTVSNFVAPGLPMAFIEDLNTLIDDTGDGKMSLYAGPCATAIQQRKTIVIPDLATSGGWTEYCQLAILHGFRAVVCTPISTSEGKILGMFVLQSREGGEPTAYQRSVLEHFTHMASMAAERKRMDTALRDSEERFRLMAETTPDVIWITDLHPERVLYCSPSFEKLWGHSVEALYEDARLWTAVIHPEDAGKVTATFEAGMHAGGSSQYNLEFRLLRADGSIRWINERAVFMADESGRPHRVSGISTDITQRKLAEAALLESQERFRLAVSASSDGIWDWDLDSDTLYMSEQAQAIYGLPAGETRRPQAEWKRLIRLHPEDAMQADALLDNCLLGAAPAFVGEWRLQGEDGSYRWVRIRGLCTRDANGAAVRVSGSVSDIDVHKRTESALQQSRRLEAMGTLAGGIAHDFNNILGVILGYGEMAQRNAPPGSRLRRDLDNIMSAGERGRSLVDRILAFSRNGGNERIAVHVEAVVRESIELVSATLPRHVRISARLAAGRAAMLGDPTQVHRVVMNLVSNAMQAMPAGGEIRVGLHPVSLAVPLVTTTTVLPAGPYLVLQVKDHGTGIPAEILDRIFDPFFTTKEVGVGSGLGLSLVHGIAQDLGGGIDVSTAVGRGSVFSLYLPQCGEAPRAERDAASHLPQGNSERVLVVDDEEPLVSLAEETLRELGYQPFPFTSSKGAFEAFCSDPAGFDAVLTDERMPGMTGTALIAEIRKLRPDMPVLLMSGYLGDLPARLARAPGADEILRKPLARSDLAIGLASLLKRTQ